MRHTGSKNTGRLNTGWALIAALAVLGTVGCGGPKKTTVTPEGEIGQTGQTEHTSKVILDWSNHAENCMVVDSKNIDPLPATRTLSMVHVAMHDAINAIQPKFETYAYKEKNPSAHPVAAAAAAAHRVLVAEFPKQKDDLDAKLAASLAEVPDGEAKTKGVAVGEAVGDLIVQMRTNDGAADSKSVEYKSAGNGPGQYQVVQPLAFVNRPRWHFVKPFVLDSADQFRSAPPPALNSADYAKAYNEVKKVGAKNSTERTADETKYAKFWYENSDTGWNRITRTVVVSKGLGLHDAARLFALVNMAMADGFIAGWDSKFKYDFWRPATAIRFTGNDGNKETAPDPKWEPLMDTPPVQDHPSTHSVLGAAAAEVLARLLGDETEFTFTSSTAEEKMVETRSFKSFSQAAAENADSRVKAGIHFRFSCDEGLKMGKQLGALAVDKYLKPLE
jgi:hypothetical protein